MRKSLITVLLASAIFGNSCTSIKSHIKPVVPYMKVGAGVAFNLGVVHPTGHYLGAKISGVDIEWVDGQPNLPGFWPNEHMTSDKPEPLAYGGSLLLEGLLAEGILWIAEPQNKLDDDEKFLTDFWNGWLAGYAFDGMNYGGRRSGLFGDHGGEGQNDLSEKKFGKYHKVAGAVSLAHSSSIAYRLLKGKRTKRWYHNETKKAQKWYHKIKFWIKGNKLGFSYFFD